MLALTLALGASMAWGAADFIAGVACRRVALITVLLVPQAAGLAVLVPVLAAARPGPVLFALAALAGVFNTVALAALYRGLARGKMGVVAPIAATDSAVPVVFGILTGDRPGIAAIVGIGLAFAGIVLTSHGGAETEEQIECPTARRDSAARGVALGLVAAIAFGAYMVALDGASDQSTLLAVAVSRLTTVVLLSTAALATRPLPALNRPDARPLLAIGALDLGASALFATATTQGILSLVGVLSSFYPVVTIILARFVLNERLDRLQRIGAAAVIVGAALMASAL